jgi:hypothetical protein
MTMAKRVRVSDDTLFDPRSAEGLEGRLLAQEAATEAKPPRNAQDLQDRATEIFQIDRLIEDEVEKLKGLKKTRENLVQSLLVGCANATQTTIFDAMEQQA